VLCGIEKGLAWNCLFSLTGLVKPVGAAEDGVLELLPAMLKGFLAEVGSAPKGC